MADSQQFAGVTPVGRMISGAIFEMTTKGYQGKVLDSPQHYIQLAIPKTAGPGLQALFDDIVGAATVGFLRGEQNRADFAWKFKDGDSPENSAKEGWAGCYVFTFRTGFALTLVDTNFQQIIDKNKIKPGYQVRVSYSIKANGDSSKPGVYLNFDMVQLVSIDKEIQTGPSPSERFAQPAAALPMQPGAVAAPQAPVAPQYGQPQAPGAPQYGQPQAPVQPTYMPQPQAPPAQPTYTPQPQAPPTPGLTGLPGMPQQPVQPDPNFLRPVIPGQPT